MPSVGILVKSAGILIPSASTLSNIVLSAEMNNTFLMSLASLIHSMKEVSITFTNILSSLNSHTH